MKKYNLKDIESIITKSLMGGNTGDDYIDARYEKHKTDFGHHWPYYRTFYALARDLEPSLIVELGGWQGTAAAHFASGNPKSMVISIDHHTDPGDEINKVLMEYASNHYANLHYVQGWTNQKLTNREKGKHALGDAPNAFIEVDQHVNGLKSGIDILFIDSWHVYEEAMEDWEVYKTLLSDGALIICDDISGGYGAAIRGMLDFWDEIPEPKFLEDRIHPGVPMGFVKWQR